MLHASALRRSCSEGSGNDHSRDICISIATAIAKVLYGMVLYGIVYVVLYGLVCFVVFNVVSKGSKEGLQAICHSGGSTSGSRKGSASLINRSTGVIMTDNDSSAVQSADCDHMVHTGHITAYVHVHVCSCCMRSSLYGKRSTDVVCKCHIDTWFAHCS